MNKLVSTIALLSITSNIAMAGGNITRTVEPEVTIPEKEIVVIDDNIKYNGLYAGGAMSYVRFNENNELRGYALTLIGGYYFNKYIGVEARYTRTLTDVDEDSGAILTAVDQDLSNLGIYIKPMYNITTGFSAYGLAGYGKAKVGDFSESGVQWGLGSKYELANGVGVFFDYMNFYDGDDFDGGNVDNTFFSSTTVGATYTF